MSKTKQSQWKKKTLGKKYKPIFKGAGEMAPHLRTHTALTEAMSSILVPALPEDGLQPAIAPALGESHSLF